jgi:hypothetical protein
MSWFGKEPSESDSNDATSNLMEGSQDPNTPKRATPLKAGTRTQSEQVLTAKEGFRQPSFMVSERLQKTFFNIYFQILIRQ